MTELTEIGRGVQKFWMGRLWILDARLTDFVRGVHHGFWWFGGARRARLSDTSWVGQSVPADLRLTE